MKKLSLIPLIVIALLISSCSDDETTNTSFTNDVQGYVKSANGTVAVSGCRVVMVTTTDAGDTAYSDASGYYKFPNATQGGKKLIFKKGSFVDTVIVTVPIIGNAPDANLLPVKPLAVYWGEYDEIQKIVRGMGYLLDSLTLADFSNPIKLNQHSAIFINCGSSSRDDLNTPGISNNLNGFLNQGGKIYASDWAFGCVKGLHPELEGEYEGNSVDSLPATIVYTPLAAYMGKTSVRINYNLGSWLMLNPGINQTVNIPFLKATYQGFTDNPIAFFRNEGNSGKLLYTTFHEEAQTTQDMVKILQFFIFEL
ncbi:MAG: carboxypeptidase-like regulatory domain-containing protein [Ignavibacteria bacterium]|nr:carboxypeptidase-like regulatory domain-containing protein [Ignavibacteria bacterium]